MALVVRLGGAVERGLGPRAGAEAGQSGRFNQSEAWDEPPSAGGQAGPKPASRPESDKGGRIMMER